MLITHVTTGHAPFDTRIFLKECKALSQAGYSVTLIAPHDHHDLCGGVNIRAVPKPNGLLSRVTKTVWSVYRAAQAENGDIYHFHDPELIPVGILLKCHGKMVVYDVHEDFPRQILAKAWIPKGLKRAFALFAEALEWTGALFFDRIIAVTPTIAKRFPPGKTVLVQNYPVPGELVLEASVSYRDRPLVIAFVGGITAIRGIREMIDALGLLPRSFAVKLVLAGAFNPKGLEIELNDLPGWNMVDFRGYQSRTEVAELLAKSRMGLVLFHPVPNHINAQPNKLFEYMSAGVPVIASDFPLWREIVGGSRCGLLVDPLDPRAIADAIQWLLENPGEAEAMGKRGLAAVQSRFNWASESKKLIKLYEGLSK